MEFFGFNLIEFIKAVGYTGVFAVIFAETGIFLGFFLPGDSLLFVAGFLASQGFLNIWVLTSLLFIAAVTGNILGYVFGYKIGPAIFNKEDSLLFKQSHVKKAQVFYDKYGGKVVMIARFIPIVRTFAPILAGVAKMNKSVFLFYNIVGALVWTLGLTLLGFWLGNVIPNIDHYLLPIVGAIIFVSILPGIIGYLQERKKARIENDKAFVPEIPSV
jgi:membrane-associated protein